MRPQPVHLFIAATVVAAVVAGVTAGETLGDPIYLVAHAGICATGLVCALRPRRRADRRPWLWIVAGQLFWLAGNAAYPVARLLGRPEPGAAEAVLWTLGYVAYGAALIIMARSRAGRWIRPAVLDMLTLTTAVGIAIWVAFISPYLADLAAEPVYAYLVIMGPLGDVVVTAGVLLLALSPGVRGTATRLLLASAVIRIAADLGTSYIPSDTVAIMVPTGIILLSNGLLIAAALHPGSSELTHPASNRPTLHPARIWFLGVGLLTAPTITFTRQGYIPAERIALFTATVVTLVFVFIRFASALRSLERAERQLSFQALHDPLTGLANRAALSQALDAAPPVTTVLYLDLDGFKAINDAAGHAAGDAILRAVSQRLRAAVRDADTVARLGGDEFVVVLPGLDESAAVPIAERILRDVAAPVPHEGAFHTVGTSIGIAGGGAGQSDATWRPAALLRAADAAMYRAKGLGRGCFVIAGSAA
ncbi:diguanylate cyclase domain-containing protein [Krasilnikovia sp. M28-CT-15]|uniref:diguanylate cyclase domain-containing protein n=1 Tax=Krasilnikovia sp. M28-CT-15 TaxID=3373540 RepID=UPI00399CC6B1